MKLPLLCGLHPKSVSASPPHLAYTLPDFIQIDSLSAELLPNVWIPFCPVEYLQYRLFVPIIIGIVPRGKKCLNLFRHLSFCSDEERLVIDTASTSPATKSTAATIDEDDDDDKDDDEGDVRTDEPVTKKRRLILSDDDEDDEDEDAAVTEQSAC